MVKKAREGGGRSEKSLRYEDCVQKRYYSFAQAVYDLVLEHAKLEKFELCFY